MACKCNLSPCWGVSFSHAAVGSWFAESPLIRVEQINWAPESGCLVKLLSNAFRGGSFFFFFSSFCVNQSYLKAAYTVTGTIETSHPCARSWPSRAGATACIGRGLGGLAPESTGGRGCWRTLREAFCSFPSFPRLDSFNPMQVTWRRDIPHPLKSTMSPDGTENLSCDWKVMSLMLRCLSVCAYVYGDVSMHRHAWACVHVYMCVQMFLEGLEKIHSNHWLHQSMWTVGGGCKSTVLGVKKLEFSL